MAIQTTEQPKCSEEQVVKRGKASSASEKLKRTVTMTIKYGLRLVLLKPQVFRFLMVHVPEIVEKAEHLLKEVVTFFTDLL